MTALEPALTEADMELWRDRHNLEARRADWDAMELRLAPLTRVQITVLMEEREVQELRKGAESARKVAEWYDSEADRIDLWRSQVAKK